MRTLKECSLFSSAVEANNSTTGRPFFEEQFWAFQRPQFLLLSALPRDLGRRH